MAQELFYVFVGLFLQCQGQTIFDLLQPRLNGAQVLDLLKSEKPENYPSFLTVPETNFTCAGIGQPGYYADVETGCQAFHRCDRAGTKSSYLCSAPTVFNQITLVCDYYYQVDCDSSRDLQAFANSRLYVGGDEPLFDNPPPDYVLQNFGSQAPNYVVNPWSNRFNGSHSSQGSRATRRPHPPLWTQPAKRPTQHAAGPALTKSVLPGGKTDKVKIVTQPMTEEPSASAGGSGTTRRQFQPFFTRQTKRSTLRPGGTVFTKVTVPARKTIRPDVVLQPVTDQDIPTTVEDTNVKGSAPQQSATTNAAEILPEIMTALPELPQEFVAAIRDDDNVQVEMGPPPGDEQAGVAPSPPEESSSTTARPSSPVRPGKGTKSTISSPPATKKSTGAKAKATPRPDVPVTTRPTRTFRRQDRIETPPGNVVTCVYTSWSATRRPLGRLWGSDLPGKDCTHIVYAYTSIFENKIFTVQPTLDDKANGGLGNIAKAVALKDDNPSLNVLIGVGGWNNGGWIFSTTFASPEGRREFIQSVIDFCADNDLDGIFIDWLTPGVEVRGGSVDDYANFGSLLSEMRYSFDENAKATKKKLLLTVTVSSAGGYLANFDVDSIKSAADLVYLISYDLAGYWNGTIMHPSPLFNEEGRSSVDASVTMWLDAGISASKLVMGIPAFARTYAIAPGITPSEAYGTNYTRDGIRGAISQAPGFLYYSETCSRLQFGGYTVVRDETMKVPYAYNADQMILYEDEISVVEKVQYAKQQHLAGVYIFAVDEDDPRAFCGNPFPLTLTAASAVASQNGKVSVTPGKSKSVKRCVSAEKSCQKQVDCLVYPSMTFANESSDLWCGAGVSCLDPINIVECPLPQSILAKGDPFESKASVYIGKSSGKVTAVKCRASLVHQAAGENVSYLCVQDGILGRSIAEYTCPENTKFTSLYLKCVVSGEVAAPA